MLITPSNSFKVLRENPHFLYILVSGDGPGDGPGDGSRNGPSDGPSPVTYRGKRSVTISDYGERERARHDIGSVI